MLELLAAKKINEDVYELMIPPTKSSAPKKEIHCAFRLMNILFSDPFAERLSTIGDKATRDELDTRMLNEEVFWKDVNATFLDDSVEDISWVMFEHDALDSMFIDPSRIIQHDWKKLKSIFQSVTSYHLKAIEIAGRALPSKMIMERA